MESLVPLVLINSSSKRTSIFRLRAFDSFSNLHNRVQHLCTRVFCLYMCYVLRGQESLFHLANHDNYDAELIGKIFKMIILLRLKRTLKSLLIHFLQSLASHPRHKNLYIIKTEYGIFYNFHM